MSTSVRGWVMVAVQCALLVVLVLAPRRDPSVVPVIGGAVIAVAGVLVLVLAFRGLGNALTPTPVPIPAAGLRTTGTYSRVRHPIYDAVLLISLGWLVAVGSGWTLLVWVALVLFFWFKASWEDSMLSNEYGAEWAGWANRTGRLLPRLRH